MVVWRIVEVNLILYKVAEDFLALLMLWKLIGSLI